MPKFNVIFRYPGGRMAAHRIEAKDRADALRIARERIDKSGLPEHNKPRLTGGAIPIKGKP